MIEQTSCKRLILRAALRHVSPMVIRLVSVSDQLDLPEFNDIFCAILGWSGDLGYLIRVHGQEFNSFHRKTRSKPCTNSDCTGRKNSFTFATPCTPPVRIRVGLLAELEIETIQQREGRWVLTDP